MEIWDRSRSGKEALTWWRQSSKLLVKEPPNSYKRASELWYSFIASSLARRSCFFDLEISSSLSLSTFFSTSVYFSDLSRSFFSGQAYSPRPPSRPTAPPTLPPSSPPSPLDDSPLSHETGNNPLNPSSWAPPIRIRKNVRKIKRRHDGKERRMDIHTCVRLKRPVSPMALVAWLPKSL